jgi:hypothetical protein
VYRTCTVDNIVEIQGIREAKIKTCNNILKYVRPKQIYIKRKKNQHCTKHRFGGGGELWTQTRKEAQVFLTVLPARTATKNGKTYSRVMGNMMAHLSIAIIRATHVCLRGSRVPTSRMSNMHPHWEDKAGMTLLKF